MRNIIARELEDAGFTVLAAKNGIEAVSMIEWMGKKPDLITLDIDMPVMDGFQVCELLFEKQKISGDDQHDRIPIVFVSANDTLENRRRGFRLGVTDFISKPFSGNDLVKTVSKILFQEDRFAGMTVLIVDDSVMIRQLMQTILKRIGVTVVTAANGLEAVDLLDSLDGSLDLILTDYLMPLMHGDEFCKLVRQKSSLDQVPVIVVSAISNAEIILSFFKSGATDYLSKPFIREELLARVEVQLRARQYVKQVEKLNQRLEYLANHDELTGIYNRRYFQEILEQKFAKAVRCDSELSCLFLDLDYFKKINDAYGHTFGDQVLEEFAAIIRISSKKSDICARYGGEEFVVLLPQTNLDSAVSCAEMIRAKTESHAFQDGQYLRQVTCSIGVASFQVHKPDSGKKLVGMADTALYAAKQQGRNQVGIYS